MSSFSDIVEQLFLALSSHDLAKVCQSLLQIENTCHSDVEKEILDSLTKKAQNEFKSVYITKVNSLIQSIQRQLNSKSPPYLPLMIELLGQGSNIINDLLSEITYLPLQPPLILILHERIMDLLIIMIKAYAEDKNIESWLQRIQKMESLNLLTLDTILQTITQILHLLSNYQMFLLYRYAKYTLYEREKKVIRELEANYIALEYGYLTSTLSDALESTSWLEIEPNVYTAQSVEDACFILTKVLDRCCQSKSEYALIAILSKIIEVLDPTRDSKLFLLLHAQLHLDQSCSSTNRKENHQSNVTSLPSTPTITSSTSELKQDIINSPFDYISHFGKAVALASGAIVEEDLTMDTPSKPEGARLSTHWLQSNEVSLNSFLVDALDIKAYIHSDPQHVRLPMQETALYLNSLVVAANCMDSLFEDISMAIDTIDRMNKERTIEVMTTLLQVATLMKFIIDEYITYE